MTLFVRPRTDQDLPALAEVLRRVHAESGYPVQGIDNPVKFLSDEAVVKAWTLTTPDDRPVGHCIVSEISSQDQRLVKWAEYLWKINDASYTNSKARFLSLGRVFIDPSVHGRGGGEKLVQQALEWTSGVLMRRLVLNVLIKDQAAIALYDRLGWTRYGEGAFVNAEGEKFKQVFYVSPLMRKSSSAATQTVALATKGVNHWDEYELIRTDARDKPLKEGD
ncbi:Hypothetical protein D9617_21g097300 [Elsinoe fawcettii]|nr:Hypothetical protein D9617_21g097300 [Elsinoe fawcettii]